MLTLLWPPALAALAALAVPLAIHLIRRPDRQVHDFAALRWLPVRTPRPRLRWRAPLLLLLRLLLVAALALLLAEPVLRGGRDAGRPWAAVAPGISAAAARAALAGAFEPHWLAPGFPPLDAPPPAAPVTVSSLVRELADTRPAGQPLAVLVPRQLAGLDAERITLGREIDWRVLPGRSAPASPAAPGNVDAYTVDATSVAPVLDPRRPAGPDEPLAPPLIALAALLFLLERLLAVSRARGEAAA